MLSNQNHAPPGIYVFDRSDFQMSLLVITSRCFQPRAIRLDRQHNSFSADQEVPSQHLGHAGLSCDARVLKEDEIQIEAAQMHLRFSDVIDLATRSVVKRALERVKSTEQHSKPSNTVSLSVYSCSNIQSAYKARHGHRKATQDARQLLQTATTQTIAN